MPPSPFKWDLNALKAGDAVEKAVVFLGLIMPIVGFAFAIYVNVYCEGSFYYR